MNTTPTPTPPPSKEPIKEGVTTHLRRVGDLINDLNTEIVALQRIEKALRDAHERLERHANLMAMETQLIDQLLKRERITPAAVKALPVDKLADRVEADLNRLVSSTDFANTPTPQATHTTAAPVAFPGAKR